MLGLILQIHGTGGVHVSRDISGGTTNILNDGFLLNDAVAQLKPR